MNIFQAVKSCFRNYINFSGRASRSEYWLWKLFVALFVTIFVAIIIAFPLLGNFVEPLFGFIFFSVVVPNLSVAIRRLHDVGRSGWWILLSILVIPYAYWMCRKGDFGDNKFGADPLAGQKGHGPITRADTVKTVAYTALIVALILLSKIDPSKAVMSLFYDEAQYADGAFVGSTAPPASPQK